MRNNLILFALLATIAGCSAQAQTPIPSPSQAPLKSAAIDEDATQSQGSKKRFKLSLTLSEPADLKVREGDVISTGQLLSDRVKDRERLEAQKRQIEFQIQRLKLPIIRPLSPRDAVPVPDLPPPSYLQEEAEVDKQSIEAEISAKERDNQQRMIDALQTLDPGTVPPSTIPHEQAKFAERDREFQKQISEQALAKGKLSKAKEKFSYEQYRHSVELSKRDLDLSRNNLEYQRQLQEFEKQERDRAFQISEATAKLQIIESQLAALSIIRSPYNGTIKKIKWLGQSDRLINVELVLFTDRSTGPVNPESPGFNQRKGDASTPTKNSPASTPNPK